MHVPVVYSVFYVPSGVCLQMGCVFPQAEDVLTILQKALGVYPSVTCVEDKVTTLQ